MPKVMWIVVITLLVGCREDDGVAAATQPSPVQPSPVVTLTLAVEPPTTTPPLATPTPQSSPTATPIAIADQPCPEWVHDLYVTAGPDSNVYPTWHPPVDPTYGCYFTHEHGDDPRLSSVATHLPPFGYVGAQGGFDEPHVGFKVFNFECSDSGDNGANQIAARLIMHMGTAGTGRYQMAFHSIQYHAQSCDGSWELDVQGMANFGSKNAIGSVCDTPRHGGRDFATLGCVAINQPEEAYEIWVGFFQVIHPDDIYQGLNQSRAYISIIPAVFDPITTVNPADLSQIVYTADLVYPGQYDPLNPLSPFRGCAREAYHGPVGINNASRPQTYVTDVFGLILPNAHPSDPGTLLQTIAPVKVEGQAGFASPNEEQFKKLFDACNSYVTAPN